MGLKSCVCNERRGRSRRQFCKSVISGDFKSNELQLRMPKELQTCFCVTADCKGLAGDSFMLRAIARLNRRDSETAERQALQADQEARNASRNRFREADSAKAAATM